MKRKKNNNEPPGSTGFPKFLTSSTFAVAIATCALVISIGLVLVGFRGGTPHDLFQRCDTSGDGVLDRAEFDACSNLLGKGQTDKYHKQQEDGGYTETDPETLRLEPFFEKLLFETMQTGKDSTIYGIASTVHDAETLNGLLKWNRPYKTHVDVTTAELSQFLPPGRHMPVGKPWLVYFQSQEHLTSDRYEPPPADGIEEVLTRLLGALHPRPFVYTRFGPHGGYATTRAVNDKYYHIMFRFHAEFQLNVDPVLPFWFTPSQFLGEMVITKDGDHIEYFNVGVPAKRRLNVDMEWLTARSADGFDEMQVDIGYMPRMELQSIGPSVSDVTDLERKDGLRPEQMTWKQEVSREEAESSLERALYPFKKVEYLEFDDAFDRAKVEDKMVHNILLWGSLDDQSC